MALLTYNIADFQNLHREWALIGKPHAGILLAQDKIYKKDPGGLASDLHGTLVHYGQLHDDTSWLHNQVCWVMRGLTA